MANRFSLLMPDIAGEFQRGRSMVRQADREQFADQQLRDQFARADQSRQHSGAVLNAADSTSRQAAMTQLAGVDPQAAMSMQQNLDTRQRMSDTDRNVKIGQMATTLARVPRDNIAARSNVYRMLVPDLRTLGLDAPDQYSPDMNELVEALAAPYAGRDQQNRPPSSVQEWEYYNGLPADQKQAYLEMKRAQQTFVPEIGGVRTVVRPGVAGGQTEVQPLSTLANEAEARRALSEGGQQGKSDVDLSMKPRIESATTMAKLGAESDHSAMENLPALAAKSDQMTGLLTRLASHPGLSGAVGARFGFEYLPATNEADFVALLDQIGGQQFLQAFESLKGGGQITEIEGKKATDAISSIQNRRQSEESYKTAINDLIDVIEAAKLRAQQRVRRAQTGRSSTVSPTSASQSPAPQPAIDYLRQNPQLAPQFGAKYGYLPEGF